MSRNYLEAFIIALMSVAFGFFATWPKYVDLQGIENKIAEKNTEIKNRQDYYNNLKKISSELEDYQENLGKIRSAFPPGADAPLVMSFVQSAAMQSGLIMKAIDYAGANEGPLVPAKKSGAGKGGETGKSVVQQYTVSTLLAGDYESLKNFLAKLEHSSRLIGTSQIEISSAKEDKKDAVSQQKEAQEKILEYSVNLFVNYYQ